MNLTLRQMVDGLAEKDAIIAQLRAIILELEKIKTDKERQITIYEAQISQNRQREQLLKKIIEELTFKDDAGRYYSRCYYLEEVTDEVADVMNTI